VFEAISADSAVTSAFGAVWTKDNFFWASTVLDSRSIWWAGKRNLVPLLDLINCQDGPPGSTVHSTDLDETGKNALTKAPWSFKAEEQVFENYGQPNHVYFMCVRAASQ
jgi:histone-lysine N-methyltransferase SETD3